MFVTKYIMSSQFTGDTISKVSPVFTIAKTGCSIIEKCTLAETEYVRKTMVNNDFFLREVSVARLIPKHPNLLSLIDSDIIDNLRTLSGKYYRLLYTYCSGGDLFDYVKSHQALSNEWIASRMLEILLGIQQLHSNGIVHRDIKLENILLDEQECAVLCDFSFCECYDDDNDVFQLPRLSKYIAIGTPGHIAPDIIQFEKKASPATDIFSLGVVFYELATGKDAFSEKDIQKRRFYVNVDQLTFPKGVPAPLSELIRKMLSPSAFERPTIQELINNEWIVANATLAKNARVA